MRKSAIFLTLLSTSAFAADLPTKAQPVPYVPCTTTNCSGFYVGGDIGGIGSQGDIVGTGINGSVLNSGAELGGHIGYQFWNGSLFAAFQVGVAGDVGTTPVVGSIAGVKPWSVTYVFRGGYGLNNFFGSGPGAPSQGPVTVFQQLTSAQMSPFFEVGGKTRNFGTGFVTGGGIEYVIGPHWTASALYRHVNYNQTIGTIPVSIGTENWVGAELNYKF